MNVGWGIWPRISWNLHEIRRISKLWTFAWGLSFFERPIRSRIDIQPSRDERTSMHQYLENAHLRYFQIQLSRLSNLPGCQKVCMVDFAVLVLELLLILVLHMFCSAGYTSTVDPIQMFFTCIVMLLLLLVDQVKICLQHQSWMSFGSLGNLTACWIEFGKTSTKAWYSRLTPKCIS